MSNNKERMEKLKAMGINTSQYFTTKLDSGATVHLIIDENGDFVQVKNDTIANQIIEDGYVKNTKLHRRFVMAQMFQGLNYISYDGKRKGYNEWLKMHGFKYSFDMILDEIRVLSKLEARDTESFVERSHFFTHGVILQVLEDYVKELEKYVETLPTKKCKGVPYKRVYGRNIFVDDLNKKLYAPLRYEIHMMSKYGRRYEDMYRYVQKFMSKMIKLPYHTPQSKAFVDAYKGEGAYYTLKNLVMYHGCNIIDDQGINYGVNSMTYLDSRLDAYSGEGWRMFALMKKVISDNGFDFKKKMYEIYNK